MKMKAHSEKLISHQTTMTHCSLWQEMSETDQGEIRGGMFDAFSKVVAQADARGLVQEFEAELATLGAKQPKAEGEIRGTLLLSL